MDSSLYNSLGNRINKGAKNKNFQDLLTLQDFLDAKFTIHSEVEFKRLVIGEFKRLLLIESLFELIKAFFQLEQDIASAVEKLDFHSDVVNFDEFYKGLSPLLLRSLVENSQGYKKDPSEVLSSLKEALRISIEGEVLSLEDLDN